MANKVFDIADDIVALINNTAAGSGFTQPLTATRDVLPSLQLSQTEDTVLVSVVPRSIELSRASRVDRLKRYAVDIGVMKRAKQSDDLNSFVAGLVDLTNEIRELLSGRAMGDATSISDTIDPIYSVDHLRQQRLFLSVLRVEYVSL